MQFKPREHPDARARKLNALAESVSSSGDAATHAAAAQASAQAAAASLVLVQAAQTSASDAATQAQSSAVLAQAGATSAADSVDAAAIHAQNAEFAKQLADQARADAQGAFDAADAAKDAALQAANDSATSAASALGSATSAAGQATIVEQRASEVELFASSATAAANIAALKSDAANANAMASSVSSTSAQVSATDAGISAAAAYQSELNAAVSSGQSGASADAAALSAASAAASQTAAGNSASASQTSATNAATSANNANTSASQASTSATQASTSASNAASSEAAAATSATNAANSATAAGGSATAAANSASSAATSSSTAQSAATSATTSANTASTQAANASSSASAAATSASQASSSSTAAGSSAAAAEASKIAAEAANTSAQSAASASSASAASASASAASASTQATLSAAWGQSKGALNPNSEFDAGLAGWTSLASQAYTHPTLGPILLVPTGVYADIRSTDLIDIDPTKEYTVAYEFYCAAPVQNYVGLACYSANGTALGNIYNSALAPLTSQGKAEWKVRGTYTPASTPSFDYSNQFPVGTARVVPLFLLNYYSTAGVHCNAVRLALRQTEDLYQAASQASIATSQAATASSAASSATTQANLSASYSALSQGWGNTRGITPNGNFGAGKTNWTQPSNFTHNATLSGRSDVISSTTRLDGLTVDNASLVNIDTSRKYRVRAGFRVLSGSTPMVFYIGFGGYDQNRNYLTHNDGTFNYPVVAGSSFTSAQGWLDLVSPVITGEGMGSTLFPVGSKYVTPVFYGDYNNTGQGWALDYLFIEDVTESEAAAGQAGIATTQAGIANSQRVLAESARGAAESASSLSATYRDQSQGYATQALNTKIAVDAIEGNLEFNRGFDAWSRDVAGSQPGVIYPASGYVASAWDGGYYCIFPTNVYGEVFTTKAFDIDPARTYRITANYGAYRTGASADTARFYIGFAGLDAAGNVVDHGAYGSFRYCVTHGVGTNNPQIVQDGFRYEASVNVTGSGNDSWNKFPPGTKKIKLLALMNYNGGDTTRNVNSYLGSIKIEDITDSLAAQTQASIATSQAAAASASAASASASAVLSANVSRGAINPNPGFDDYSSPASPAYPANWVPYAGSNSVSRIADSVGGWSMRVVGAAGDYESMFQYYYGGLNNMTPSGWYVVEADVTLESGTLQGAGIWLDGWNAPDVGYVWGNGLALATDPDVTGSAPGNGVVGKRYRYAKLMQAAAGVNVCRLYAMTNYVGGPFGPTSGAKTLVWNYAAIRPATQQEIRDQTVLAPMQATVTSHSSAIATLDTRTASYLTKVSAGAGTAELAMVATDSGGSPASSITLKADKIRLGSLTQPALEIVGGVSTFNGELNVGGSSGARVNITKDLIRVFDASGVLRVRFGIW